MKKLLLLTAILLSYSCVPENCDAWVVFDLETKEYYEYYECE